MRGLVGVHDQLWVLELLAQSVLMIRKRELRQLGLFALTIIAKCHEPLKCH
jgi:hypothetical protein